jgi:hypothetical protein
MRIIAFCLGLAAATTPAAPVAAHEFWIEPLDYQVPPDGNLTGHLVNGEAFAGVTYSFLPQRFTRFDLAMADSLAPVEGRLGDKPALNLPAPAEGLAVAAYVSQIDVVRYDEFAAFLRFAAHKDFPDMDARHRAAGHPETGFGEAYSRFAKTLIAVGAGAGADRRLGLETEIVALANPYVDDVTEGLPVQVFSGEDIRADAQVELFEKAPDGTVEITYHRTDAEGVALLPVRPGHSYLVDAVLLREPAPDLAAARDVVWETLWASLTFAVP